MGILDAPNLDMSLNYDLFIVAFSQILFSRVGRGSHSMRMYYTRLLNHPVKFAVNLIFFVCLFRVENSFKIGGGGGL